MASMESFQREVECNFYIFIKINIIFYVAYIQKISIYFYFVNMEVDQFIQKSGTDGKRL